MARFKRSSAREFNRAVRLTNALRVQEDEHHERPETRHERTNIVGLLKECHRLSLAISIDESSPKELENQETKLIPYPNNIHLWKHFPEVSDNLWEILTEECALQDQKVFPSSWECDLSLEGIQRVKSPQDVHTFRHLTVHRFVSRIWRELVLDENFWRGSYDSLPDKLVDWDCYSMSDLSFKTHSKESSCLASLTIGRQEVPLFVVQYATPQHLPVETIIDGVQNLKDDYHELSLRGQLQSPLLSSVLRCFSEMIRHGIWRGIVDIGVGLIFLKVSKKDPNTLKLYPRIPRDEVQSDREGDLRHTVVGEYAALALCSLLDNAPTQQWWRATMKLDNCMVNTTTIMRQLALSSNPTQTFHSKVNVVRYYATNSFCTPRCLAGLLRRGKLDPACPNVGDHGDKYHEIDGEQFMDCLEAQLTLQSPQFELQTLHITGTRNQLLRGTLEDYGYSFLVKAAERGAGERLEEEFDLYKRLTPLQGVCIPICVGLLDLETAKNMTLSYNGRELGKMIIMSWEGISATHALEIYHIRRLGARRGRIRRRLEEIGIRNIESDLSNFAWNPVTKSLKLVDFKTAPNITPMRG